MTHDETVQIARDALRPRFGYITSDEARLAVAALDQHGLLAKPGELAALRAVAEAAQAVLHVIGDHGEARRDDVEVVDLIATLDAAPAATNHPTYEVSPGAFMVVEAPAGNTAATRVICGCPDCPAAETTSVSHA